MTASMRQRTARWLALAVLPLVATACTLGPNYVRPKVDVPATYRGAEAPTAATRPEAQPASLADLKWFELFNDSTLTTTIDRALAQNFDLRIAAERIVQAREQYRIVGSARFPTVDAGASAGASRRSVVGATPLPQGADADQAAVTAGFSVTWEVDVWGRLRRLDEAARARYLATEEGRRGVTTTLIADVSQAYLTLRTLDLQLEIARRTRDIATDSLRLTQLRLDRGAASALDVRQAEQLLYSATAQIASLERAVSQTENGLSLLIGQAPGDMPRGESIEALQAPPSVPAGLPSSLLERRPDIRQAEQELIAANAEIGAAKAEFFPRISLTGLLGVESRGLSDLLSSRARTAGADASVLAPIFTAGRTRANVRYAESVQRELVVGYQRAIYSALRDVADALAQYRGTTEQRAQQERLVEALRDATRLSTQRYQGGLDSYLQVLDAQRALFQGELDLATLRRDELVSVVELYRALGGGWME